MEGLAEYTMATALLNFKQAYSTLCKASRAMPELDVSEGYPFYLLNFEEIEPAVIQWCNFHANSLLEQVPDRVDNPACTQCTNFRSGIGADGRCKGNALCPAYPFIIFSREACMPLLLQHYTAEHLVKYSEGELHGIYIEICNKIHQNNLLGR